MFIGRALVDGFGCLSGQEAADLSPGLNVFLGQNEAGKSTCQKFFRAMLFGYRRGKSTIEPNLDGRVDAGAGKRGRQGGGTLFLDFSSLAAASFGGRIILTRRPGVSGGALTLTGESGERLDESVMGAILPGLTVEVFDRVFSVTLHDLMEFASLSGDSVRHALHGAAFGTGFKSPADILKTLDGRMRDLHSKSPSCALSLLNRRLEDTDSAIKRLGPVLAQYREAESRLSEIRENQRESRALVAGLELERAALERRINAWPVFEDLRDVRAELEAAGLAGAYSQEARFTPDGAERLESILAMKGERELALAEARDAVRRIGDEISRIPARTRAAHWRLGVQHLLEQKENRRAEGKSIPLLRRDIAQIAERQKEIAAGFGPGWGLGEARGIDVSLAARDRVRDAEAGLLAACGKLAHEERDEARIAAEAALAKTAFEAALAQRPARNFPAALADAALPDEPFIEDLGAALATAADALERLPVLSLKLDEAARGLDRSLADIGPDWNAEWLAEADLSMPGKQRIQNPAHQLNRRREEESLAAQRLDFSRERLAEAREAEALARSRLAVYASLPDELELAGRGNALRRLEKAWMGLEPARSACVRASERAGRALDELKAPKGKLRLLPPFSSLFLFMAGIGGTIGGLWLDRPSLIPLGGGLAGLGLILGGAWIYLRKREERRKLDGLSELREIEDRASAGFADAAAQVDSILLDCPWMSGMPLPSPPAPRQSGGVTPPWQAVGESFLDRAQSGLEKLRADLARKRRDEEEAEKAGDALLKAEAEERKAAAAHGEAVAACKEAESAWGECLAGHRLPSGLNPEATDNLFYQIGIAKLKRDELLDRRRDLGAAVAAIRKCLDRAGQSEFLRLAAGIVSQSAPRPGNPAGNRPDGMAAGTGGALAHGPACGPGGGLTSGPACGPACGSGGGLTYGPAGASSSGPASGPAFGPADGMAGGMAAGLADGLADGPADDLAAELAAELAAVQKAVALSREAAAFNRELALWQKSCDERRNILSALEERHAASRSAVLAAREGLCALERDWAAWLQAQGLPQGLNPATAAEALRLAEKYTSLENDRLELEGRLRLQRSGLEDYIAQVMELSRDLGFDSAEWNLFLEPVSSSASDKQDAQPAPAFPDFCQAQLPGVSGASAAFSPRAALAAAAGHPARLHKLKGASEDQIEAALRLLDALDGAVQKALADNALLAEKKEQLAGREQDMRRAALALAQAGDDLAQLLRAARVDDAESFRSAFAAWERASALSGRERSLFAALKNGAAEEGIGEEEFTASLAAVSLDALREKKSAVEGALSEAREKDRHLAGEGGELAAVKNSLRGSDEDFALRAARSGLLEDIERVSREWSVLSLARQLLLRAKERFEERGQSGVILHATEIFNNITDGEYDRVFVRLGQDAIEVRRKNGVILDPDRHLSQGAKEQLYLALRLAYIRNHAKNAEPAPVFMDDVLVNFDPARAARTARILAEFALENQVFFFTCHPQTAEMLFKAGQNASTGSQGSRPALLKIENGVISPGN